jgi:hypothetical protein
LIAAKQPRLGRKEPNMLIIGCDYHPSVQRIAFVNAETGESGEDDCCTRTAKPKGFTAT